MGGGGGFRVAWKSLCADFLSSSFWSVPSCIQTTIPCEESFEIDSIQKSNKVLSMSGQCTPTVYRIL